MTYALIPLVASVSGGKDSAAMCLHLRELGIAYRAVFLDTGWEAAETYDYLRGPLNDAIGPIEWVKGPYSMQSLILKKGMFPSRVRRFCTKELKIFPFLRWAANKVPLVNAVGIRAAESQSRSKLGCLSIMREAGGQIAVWRPLLHWSEQDVINIHKRHGLVPNPLYLRGSTRVGCWPCIYARKSEIAAVADTTPERIDQIETLERLVSAKALARHGADSWEGLRANPPRFCPQCDVAVVDSTCVECGEELVGRPLSPPTYFHPKSDGKHHMTLIRDVVTWAKTSRGGTQLQLLAEYDREREGCMRWGMCE